jgi:hypothetical protein
VQQQATTACTEKATVHADPIQSDGRLAQLRAHLECGCLDIDAEGTSALDKLVLEPRNTRCAIPVMLAHQAKQRMVP